MATGLLSFPFCELAATKSSPLLLLLSHHHGRARRPTFASALRCSSLPATDNFGEDVLRTFLTERQLHGDFVSKASDMLWRRNDLKLDVIKTSAAKENDPQHEDIHEGVMSDGFLRLATTRERISGDSSPPANKKHIVEEKQNESDKRKKLNLLRYEALKGELLLLTTGIGAACSVYCVLTFSTEAAVSYAVGVLSSCLYLQLLYRHADSLSKESIPEIFLKRKLRKIGIRSEDLKDSMEKTLGGTTVALSSPRLIIPAVIYGLWALSNHFQNDIFNFQLVPGMMGFFAYKAAALVQVYRDNEDLRMIFPDDDGLDGS